MTDTPTPQMTPEQRAELVAELRLPWFTNGCEWYQVRAANSLEADGVTIATLTAECDAAQAEIARLAKINVKLCADFNLMNQHGAKQDTEIARLTAALATAREDGMREAAALIKPTYARPCECSGCYCGNIDSAQEVASWDSDSAAAKTIEAAIQKGAAT